jgi:hypothetical protein
MSQKVRDNKNRWRSKTVAFRVSPEEWEHIESAVRLSGLTKQDYIIRRLLCRDVIVQGNPRVYKALKNELVEVKNKLNSLLSAGEIDNELVETIKLITVTLYGLRGEVDEQ